MPNGHDGSPVITWVAAWQGWTAAIGFVRDTSPYTAVIAVAAGTVCVWLVIAAVRAIRGAM